MIDTVATLTVDNTKMVDDINVVSTIDAIAASTDNNEDPSDYDEKMLSIDATKYACFNSSATADIKQLLSSLRRSDCMPAMVEIMLAPDHPSTYDDRIVDSARSTTAIVSPTCTNVLCTNIYTTYCIEIAITFRRKVLFQ